MMPHGKAKYRNITHPNHYTYSKSEIDQQIIGLETGADAYIPKPFNMRYLKVLVKNTLEKRSNMYKTFSQKSIIIPSEFSTNKVDEEFLQKVINYIEENIENTELSVDLLAQNMNLSRSQVYRKIKALTDLTANEFIRQIRLKKALNLLSEGTLKHSVKSHIVLVLAPNRILHAVSKSSMANRHPILELHKVKNS